MSLCKHSGNKTQIDPKVQPLSEQSHLVSTEFIVQERAKSRSSHLTTQAFLHPKSVQNHELLHVQVLIPLIVLDGRGTLIPQLLSLYPSGTSSSSPRIIHSGVHLNSTFSYWYLFSFSYKLCKYRDPHRHNKAYLKHT